MGFVVSGIGTLVAFILITLSDYWRARKRKGDDGTSKRKPLRN